MTQALVGIIGGSGIYRMDALANATTVTIDTPYGPTSDPIVLGEVGGTTVAFLARHGSGHRLIPSEVPYRANIYALKALGVRYIVAFSAVGSLREHIAPLDFVLPDQFIDLTKRREASFFGDGAVAHVSMAEPICAAVADLLGRAVTEAVGGDVRVHRGGTYVCIEGPSFSTRAESHWYRAMGADVIGMTNQPEAKLAREAQVAYAVLATVTDFDCWHPREPHVTADSALENLRRNAERAQRVAEAVIRNLGREKPVSAAHSALAAGLVTPLSTMAPDVARRLAVVIGSPLGETPPRG